ncbi:hypothetical protein ANCCAN_13952 [Ancylostoma caninum]|uniref:TIL domain-containing protein n=1 Tax=Ancylostoma caninum TaxID=29170 RepID=A0A368GBG5_ANCCA|nr:hypothetical protein ANCCAN_13952 [Ancylostoma caninum]
MISAGMRTSFFCNTCICKPGLFRNSQGKCVDDCYSEPCGDPNALRAGCAQEKRCLPSCLQLVWNQTLPRWCKDEPCIPFAWVCKGGYVYDPHSNKCIPHLECKLAFSV